MMGWKLYLAIALLVVAFAGGGAVASAAELGSAVLPVIPGGAGSDGSLPAPAFDNSAATSQTIGEYTFRTVDNGSAWTAGMVCDGDGAPKCYAPPGAVGLDYLANAGRPGNWWGVATDDGTRSGNPVLNDQGCYVSTTSLVDARFPRTDQRRYVDSTLVPFLALGRDVMTALGVGLGDLAYAFNLISGQGSGCVIADVAPSGHAHEGSIALCDALGVSSDPKHGGTGTGIAYVVFAQSGGGWPNDSAAADAAAEFERWGGEARLRALVGA